MPHAPVLVNTPERTTAAAFSRSMTGRVVVDSASLRWPGLYARRFQFPRIVERPELSKRDRSLVTVTALVAGGHTEQLPFHLKRAKENGVTEPEIIETITHLAFYCGWPKAMSAITVVKETFQPSSPAQPQP